MIPRGLLPACLAVVLLVLPLPAAVAAQLKAGEPPKVTGPLSTSLELKNCKKQIERTDGGQIVARFKICSRYYRFDPDRENNSDKNYGAFWIQATIDPANGWCARSGQVDLTYDRGVLNRAPKPGTTERARRKEAFTTKLIVDTEGHSPGEGTVKNTFKLRPGKLRARMVRAKKYRLGWTGRSTSKLAWVAGLELTWPQDGEAPVIRPSVGAVLDRNCP